MKEIFHGSFTQQEPIPADAIEAAVRVMETGRLHRYNVDAGEAAQPPRPSHGPAPVTMNGAPVAQTPAGGVSAASKSRMLGTWVELSALRATDAGFGVCGEASLAV